jgi:Na+/alanine symporter
MFPDLRRRALLGASARTSTEEEWVYGASDVEMMPIGPLDGALEYAKTEAGLEEVASESDERLHCKKMEMISDLSQICVVGKTIGCGEFARVKIAIMAGGETASWYLARLWMIIDHVVIGGHQDCERCGWGKVERKVEEGNRDSQGTFLGTTLLLSNGSHLIILMLFD